MATIMMNNIDDLLNDSEVISEITNLEERIQNRVDIAVQEKMNGIRQGLTKPKNESTSISEPNIRAQNFEEKLSELNNKFNLSVPYSFTTHDEILGVRWEYKRYISCKGEPIITRVEVVFYDHCYGVYVRSDEYKLTKIKEICTDWECIFHTEESLIIYLLQLKDLGFIK